MMVILYVADQARSREFYRAVLGREPILDVPGMTEFEWAGAVTLGLMPEAGIAKILGSAVPHPANGAGVPRCELYWRVPDANAALRGAIAAGAVLASEVLPRNWGEAVGYVADPDGHILAFAEPLPVV